jgi:hypothetical protein
MSEQSSGPAKAGPQDLVVGGRHVRVEPISARKASVAFALIRRLQNIAPELTKAYGRFSRDYGEENVMTLDRLQARMRYPSRPLIDGLGNPVREPDMIENPRAGEDHGDGYIEPAELPNPKAGEIVWSPSPVDTMTDADWEACDGRLRVPKAPGQWETLAALLPVALEQAEDETFRLLALFTMSNADVKAARKEHADGTLGALQDRVEQLMDDAGLDELLELAAVANRVITEQMRSKIADLGDDVGNLMRLVGMTPPASLTSSIGTPSSEGSDTDERSSSSSPTSTPPSSTSSPAPTPADSAAPTPSSTPLSTSSEGSTDGYDETPSKPAPLESESGPQVMGASLP